MYFDNQPIILDFDRFIDYVGKKERLELTSGKGELRNADLMHLNDLVHFRLDVVNAKAKQISFSLLNTFFHIGCVSELFQIKIDPKTKKKYLTVIKERVGKYDAMSDDEKYFFLLETFWCYVNWEQAYECRIFWDLNFYESLLKEPVGKEVTISSRELKRKGKIDPPIEIFAVEVLEAFGFYSLTWDETLEKRPSRFSFPYKSIALSEMGKSMLTVLMTDRKHISWGDLDPYLTKDIEERIEKYNEDNPNEGIEDAFMSMFGLKSNVNMAENEVEEPDEDDDELSNEGNFEDAFLLFYKDLKIETRFFPIERPFIGGNYVLRVALDTKIYRDIAIAGSDTLNDLHFAIQGIYGFDDDHLYAFYLGLNGMGRPSDTYSDPRGSNYDGENSAGVFKIGELALYKGRSFDYLFDFGDCWEFKIEVLDILTNEKELKKYKLLQKIGNSPKQYGHYR